MAKNKDLTPEFTDLITGGQSEAAQAEEPKQAKTKTKKQPYKTVSVGLTGEELTEVERIARIRSTQACGPKYAITEFIRRYNEGTPGYYSPKTKII